MRNLLGVVILNRIQYLEKLAPRERETYSHTQRDGGEGEEREREDTQRERERATLNQVGTRLIGEEYFNRSTFK